MSYILRAIEKSITEHLGQGKAIVIFGPRQAGKTTLVRKILETYPPDEVASFQADDPRQASIFVPDVEALGRIVNGRKVIFIDEAQKIENAGLVLKLMVDNYPQIQVIATGSSSFELSDKIKESMVGRVFEFTLMPLSADEIATSQKGRLLFDLHRMLQLGGYPEVIINNDLKAKELITNLTGGYLYKDVLSLANVRQPDVLRKLLTALSLQVGQEVSYNELSQMMEVSRTTIERYLYLLEQCFVIFRLDPISSNPRKLLASRKRKIYFYDLGVRSALANQLEVPIITIKQLGGVFENFCILERRKSLFIRRQQPSIAYYWRSPDSELDYLEQYNNQTYAYEFKWNKVQKNPPPRFVRQFPEGKFVSINKQNFWRLIDS